MISVTRCSTQNCIEVKSEQLESLKRDSQELFQNSCTTNVLTVLNYADLKMQGAKNNYISNALCNSQQTDMHPIINSRL